jgi:hypothetical protein
MSRMAGGGALFVPILNSKGFAMWGTSLATGFRRQAELRFASQISLHAMKSSGLPKRSFSVLSERSWDAPCAAERCYIGACRRF